MLSPLDVLRLYPAHDGSLAGALASRLSLRADTPFLLFQERRWTWGAFAETVERAAGLFAARGVVHGDRVAVMARNDAIHLVTLFALARLGAIMVPVNPEFGLGEAGYVLAHAEVSGVIAAAEAMPVAREAAAGLAKAPWFLAVETEFEAAAAASPRHAALAGGPDDTVIVIYTSGTTGRPKGVMHSQRSFTAAGEAYVQRVRLQPEDRVMVVLPFFHMNALFYSVAGALAAGASLLVMPRFSASSFWPTVADKGATVVNIIEAIGTILQARPRSEYRPGHGLRAVYGVRQRVRDTFRDEFGVPHLFAGFGMTEIPGVTCNPFDGEQKPGSSMGKLGLHPDPQRPWAECRITDEDGREVPAGEVGELTVKTPILMQGYFRDPEQTRAAFRDGWFLTGDLVRRDADGWFFFVGRKKDIIRRRGENISGAELDQVIGSHPAVYEVAAIAVPSALGEDEILAAVVRRPGHDLTAAEVADWCRARLTAMKVPRYVAFLDALPHTPTHKIAKAALRQDPSVLAGATDLGA